jgi:iron complex transport system substrate-binding protein
VRDGRLHEIKSAVILTPGPVAISEGLPALLDIFDQSKAGPNARPIIVSLS